jgi:hypothetical protein
MKIYRRRIPIGTYLYLGGSSKVAAEGPKIKIRPSKWKPAERVEDSVTIYLYLGDKISQDVIHFWSLFILI